MFKKITALQITPEIQNEVRTLITKSETVFEGYRFAPPSAQEKSRMGFSPNPTDKKYVSMLGDNILLTVTSQGKSVSPFAIKQDMELIKAAMLKENPTTTFNKNSLKIIKEDATASVTARALLTEPKVSHILIRPNGMVLVEGKGKAMEDVVSMVRKVLGSFPAFPVEVDECPSRMLKEWTKHEGLKRDIFTLGSQAVILSGEGMEYKTKGESLDNDANAQSILKDDNSMVTSVEVEYDGVIGVTITDELIFEGIKIDKGMIENEEDVYSEMFKTSSELIKMIDDVFGRLTSKEEEA
ncbi:exonuclease recombination-associated [Vibrio phage K406]